MFYVNMAGIGAFIFIILLASTSGNKRVNYCGSKMCGYTGAHTFCQFASGPSSDCTGYIPAPLSSEETSRVLARLNRRRDDAASGKMRGLPSAGNMLKLRWVGELAREAQLWADQCRPPQVPEEHDTCRDLYSITVGQCVASVVGEAPGLRVESMVDIWYMQSTYYKGNVTLYEPPESSKRFYGDFAQMMWARTYMVGCGRSRFMVQVRGRYRTVERLVCNFAPLGPPLYRPLWMPGVPATTCPTRSRSENILTSSLCDYQQGLNQLNDEDNSMSMEEHILLNTVLEMERNETQDKGSLDEIYLTYLAIVTMQNSDLKTAHSNSIQKRDVDEKISTENADSRNTNSGKSSDLGKFLNETIESHTIQIELKKKFKTIGRPKAYNMEELSDIGGDQADENHDTTEAISKDKKKFYEDYTMDFTEENVTETNERIDIENNLHRLPHNVIQNNDIEQQSETLARTLVEKNATIENVNYAVMPTEKISWIPMPDEIKFDKIKNEKVIQGTEAHPTIYNDYTTKNDSMAAKDKTMDDYLSDPETVRQLQEALDRMERESNTSKGSGKTRRDLRGVPSDLAEAKEKSFVANHVTFMSGNNITGTVSPQDERNISEERAPKLNMVMKYMPYLKTYENEILGTQSSANGPFSSGLMICSVTLVLFCVPLIFI